MLGGRANRAAWLAALLARRQSAAQQYRWRSPLRWLGRKNSLYDMHLRWKTNQKKTHVQTG